MSGPTPTLPDDVPIRLRGVRQNNLRGVDVDIPYDRLTVVTGVSGSGKSSLVFDTLYAEGQRRYVESFSAYARQFLERMPRPAAERIDALPPAVAVAQANPVRTSRSTVGTVTELTDHLKLLFAKAATLHCAACDVVVEDEGAAAVADAVAALPAGTRVVLTFPLPQAGGLPFEDQVRGLRAAGLFRWYDPAKGAARDLERLTGRPDGLEIVVDRLKTGRDTRSRVLESAEQALRLGRDRMALHVPGEPPQRFSRGLHCAACDRDYRPAQANLFSFNSPLGACPTCRGFGRTVEMDVGLLVPDPSKTLAEGAIRPWTTKRTRTERKELAAWCRERGVPMDVPWRDLSYSAREDIAEGTADFYGLRGWMEWLKTKAYKMHVRVLLSRYRSYRTCTDCGGARRRPESLQWRLGGRHVFAWETAPIGLSLRRLRELELTPAQDELTRVVREAIDARLEYLVDVGLGYLTLDRATRTLSGGEFQRVNLATALGAALVNTLYVLDEPSVGLHPRDTDRLLGILGQLRDRGNTLVVVEHDPDTIAAADHVIDLGPGAGEHGGTVLFQGPRDELDASPTSVTARFLRGEERVRSATARPRRRAEDALTLRGCTGHNLQSVDLRVPRGCLTVVVGVSGSGKSSLITGTLHPALRRHLGRPADEPLPHAGLDNTALFLDCELVDQGPIGRTPRSNPATYSGAMLHIRHLLAGTDRAQRLRLRPNSFSFNTRGGRCPACEGAGQQLLEMQFLADVYVPCAECEGRRFRAEVLDVRLRGKNVNDLLALTVEEALAFFDADEPRERKLRLALAPFHDVGLGYLRLGQPAPTLSGGEAQRMKLASHLPRRRTTRRASASKPRTLFLFDEPTTGLHLADVRTLLACLERLVDDSHTVVVIEHHVSVMAAADHVIELGPGGGAAGGRIVAEGTPEQIAAGATETAPYLARELAS